MKKKISLILAILICCTIFVTAVSCNSTNKITKMEEKLNKADSYKITITMDNIPMLGKATMTMKIEGNKTFTSGMFGESDIFTEEVNGKTYVICNDPNINERFGNDANGNPYFVYYEFPLDVFMNFWRGVIYVVE